MFDKKKWMQQYQSTERYKKYQKNYKSLNKEKLQKQDALSKSKRRKENPEKYRKQDRRHKLIRRYGITPEEYDALYLLQEGRCAICSTLEKALSYQTSAPQRLAIDHDHKTGKVRGLLCFSCNRALGYLKDSPLLLEKAIEYLQKG